MRWRTGALVREAWVGLFANALRSAVILVIAAAVLGVVAALELRDVRRADAFQDDYTLAGGQVAIVVSEDNAPTLSMERCAAVAAWPGVVAAGGAGEPSLATFASAPGVLFQQVPVTAGLLRVWDPASRIPAASLAGAVVTGTSFASEMGLRPGMHVARAGEEPVTIAAVIDPNRRNPTVSRWVYDVVAPAGGAQQCWVEFTPAAYAGGSAALAAWFATGDQAPIVRPYIRPDEFTRDAAADFAGRPQRYGWVAAGALLALIAWLMTWFRRADFGLYLALGTPRAALLTILIVESWLLIAAACLTAWVYAVAIDVALHNEPTGEAVLIGLRTAGLAGLVAIGLAPVGLLLVRGNILSLLKDR